MSVGTVKLHQMTPPAMLAEPPVVHAAPCVQLNNGNPIPLIGLGTWQAEPEKLKESVKVAIQMGYRHVDCAAIYGNEEAVGEALQECFQEGICRREDLFVTSKLWNNSHGDEATVMKALQQTLDDLKLDYLDMYLIHWPVPLWKGSNFDNGLKFHTLEERPLETTWKSMESCVQAGKTKGIGVSNFSVPKLKHILDNCTIPPAINQAEHHPYLQQTKLRQFCREHNIHMTGFSPLASTNHKPSDDLPPLLEHPTIVALAKEKNATPAQVVLRWAMLQQTSVIPKSTHQDRIRENLAAVDLSLTETDMNQIAQLDANVRTVQGDIFTSEPGCPFTQSTLWDE